MPVYFGRGFRGGRGGAVAAIIFGVFWLSVVTSMIATSIRGGAFILPMLIFPAFGIFFVILAIRGAKGTPKRDVPPDSDPLPPLSKDDDPFSRFDEKFRRDEELRSRQENFAPSDPAPRQDAEANTDPNPGRPTRCRHCGATIRPGDTFCSKCGHNTRR